MSEHSSKHEFVAGSKYPEWCAYLPEGEHYPCMLLRSASVHAQAEPKPVEITVEDDDYRPDKYSLSNSEVRSTGILCGGAVQNIARELLSKRAELSQAQRRIEELGEEVAKLNPLSGY